MKKNKFTLGHLTCILVAIFIVCFIMSEINEKKDKEWQEEMSVVSNRMRQSVGPRIHNSDIWCLECVGNKLCVYCEGKGWIGRNWKCSKCCNVICCRCGGTGLK